ncbi:hypothetical protein SRABI27_02298 [Pedobacter sp. Bi27]|uniref:hypothetical protein n=1 Tax=unclassified Pedobacter TaxID=2628915 RepID=UPI001D3D9BC7|nr:MULTISPECIES: hypothetical protein [unclassified Pedobacter]CAH0223954.1 hypothetical protein SRABI27_02298 [Pedobacter sp. Bi27]CAH0237167.1 hypothetical protein SRABI36_02871 [Pedobacter sp. Bi36]CAH0263444.1 hypothetical protein SRABI126_03271 [Pedobacter sp. Bi126]
MEFGLARTDNNSISAGIDAKVSGIDFRIVNFNGRFAIKVDNSSQIYIFTGGSEGNES